MGRRRFRLRGIEIATAAVLVVVASSLASVADAGARNPAGSSVDYERLVSVSADGPVDVWTVGSTALAEGQLRPLVKHDDGNSWTVVATPDLGSRSRFNSVSALSPSNVWAVGATELVSRAHHLYHGKTLIEHWDGSAWTQVPSVSPSRHLLNELTSVVAISSNDVWAAGYRYTNDEDSRTPVTLTEHWDGTRWTWVKSGIPSGSYDKLHGLSATSSSDVWAVGQHGQSWTQHWNGATWATAQAPVRASLKAVTAISPADAWAVGNTATLHWDGTTWRQVASPDIGSLTAVSAAGPHDVWAAAGPKIEHWNGTTWRQVDAPTVAWVLGLSAQSSTDAWAVGHLGVDALIEHWDGSTWSYVEQGA